MGNGTVDSDWPTCVGCAILHRSFGKTQTKVPDVCQKCLQKFCWDGTVDESKAAYHPEFKVNSLKSVPGNDEVSGAANLSANVLTRLTIMILCVATFS